MDKESKFEMIRTITAVLIATIIAFIIILFVSDKPISTIKYFVIGPLLKSRYMGNVIEQAIPLIFSGVATAILFQTGLFNLGAEGIYYFSGLLAAIVGIKLSLPWYIHPAVAIIVGCVAGAVVMAIIGFFKAKWNASELVISLMFNSILYGIGLYILNYYFKEVNTTNLQSVKMQDTVLLNKIVPGTRIHSGLIIALVVVFVIHLFMYRTKWGYALRMTGYNKEFAKYSGINTVKAIIIASLVAGCVAGIGGSVEIIGMYDRFQWAALPGLGFDGALIAMLAKNKPSNVIFSALFLAYIRIGADLMARMTNVPAEMVGIMQGLIILLISGRKFMQGYRNKMLLKGVKVHG
ncbi:ABC transporter permease [Candidatus Clostridium radicumherbarum]|uniref:ABC transporter permease n=1 Tax=Candidatus Clostridium radicumherbarum TaxID=3381662 RepID=A0ABW8TUS0_9CLOT